MRQFATFLVLCAAWTASGCATGLREVALPTTAGQETPPSAFSEFASDVQNYSADRDASTASPSGDDTSHDSDLLLAPAPEMLADDGTDLDPSTAGDGADQSSLSQSGRLQEGQSGHGLESASSDLEPPAPGPEVIADFGREAGFDSVCQTSAGIDADLTPCDHTEPPVDTDDAPQPLIAAGAEAMADLQADADWEPEFGAPPGPEPEVGAEIVDAGGEDFVAADQREAIPAPQADSPDSFKPDVEAVDVDRVGRHLADVPVDIRPTAGVMPDDLAASEFERSAHDDPRQRHEVEPIVCSYTPWTICFRPLYFEEVALERYGMKRRFIQPAASGVHFFSSVALLPYKMRVRPPRSCVCSNGFSRIGDCPPPGYGECVWRWDAAIVEAAAVTGFVFILP